MAKFQAIAATGQAILGLLADAVPKPEFATARFELFQVGDFQPSIEEGISLYLYRVVANSTRRNMPPSIAPNGKRFRPPIPLDLHYMLSAWAKTAIKQQRLLGWAIRTLADTPILPASLLNHFGPESDIFRPSETVELILDQLTLSDLNNLWSATKISPPLSVNYVARMVAIESTLEIVDAEPVQTRELNVGT
ncbi:MAG TPA: DUF4255 domain-containing protein [Pyrinomonadaceae bacterium]|nr:DUF4255 domain-containing protein [Pyrinomonadaceae bacterium]